MELSKDWKLIYTDGSPRLVHARGCDRIKDWVVDGSLEIQKFRPDKQIPCKTCERLIYFTIGAKDYLENLCTYKTVFKDVPVSLLRQMFVNKKIKCQINGHCIYFRNKKDLFYIDLEFGDVRLYHKNYQVRKRESDKPSDKSGYHEHKLNIAADPLCDALSQIAYYDFNEAKEVHEKNRKKRPRMTLSEYDPQYYGF